MTTEALREIIVLLVHLSILTFETYDEVKFQKRIYKYSFKKAKVNDFILRSLKESKQNRRAFFFGSFRISIFYLFFFQLLFRHGLVLIID